MELTNEQESAVTTPAGTSLLVSAAAGSGKTRVLVERLLWELEEKDALSGEYNDIGDYLVITFTNAAAAELRNRIADALNARLEEPDCNEEKRAHLRKQSRRLYYDAHISTIDSFCIDLLRQYARLFDLNPDFRICDDEEENEIAGGILNGLLERKYKEALENPNSLEDSNNKEKNDGADQENELSWEHYCKGKSRFFKLADFAEANFTMDKAHGSNLEEMVLYVHKKLEICDDPERWIREHSLDFRSAEGEKQKNKEKDAEVLLQDATKELLDLVREFDKLLFKEKMRSGALTFTDVERLAVRLLKGETDPAWTDARKAAVQYARESLRGQFKEIMIDEYQDTNRLQDSLFEALSDSGNNFFLVGDVKQSIYRFRNADPTIFLEKYNSWAPPEDEADGQGVRMTLSRNFRSRPQILSAVNQVFSILMSRDCGEVDFQNEGRFAFETDVEIDRKYDVEMNVLVNSSGKKKQQEKGQQEMEDQQEKSQQNEDEQKEEKPLDPNLREARFVASRIRELVRYDDCPEEKDNLHVEEKDIAVLIPYLRPVQKYYVQALTEAGIRIELEEEVKFNDFIYDHTEVSVAVSLLQLIDNPRRDIPLLSVLNSPVFNFTPERLADIRAGHKDVCFYDAMVQNEGPECAGFIRELDRLRLCFRDMPVHILLENLYRETHMREIFGAMRDGGTRLENLDALSDKARKLENAGIHGLPAFLRRVGSALSGGQAADYVTVTHGSGGVKLMTIHRAKGLEFPVVFLCGLGKRFNLSEENNPMLFHIREGLGSQFLQTGDGWRAKWDSPPFKRVKNAIHSDTLSENMRLLYVGMTRAQDKLIMTMTIDEKNLKNLKDDSSPDLSPAIVMDKIHMSDWLLLATLYKPEAEVLTSGEKGTKRGGGWVFTCLPDGGKDGDEPPRKGENLPEEVICEKGRRVYAHADTVLRPARLSPSQLDGQYEISGRGIRKADVAGTGTTGENDTGPFSFPKSLGLDTDLSAPERGTAAHKIMQFISLDRAGSVQDIENEIMRLQKEKYITQEEAESIPPESVFRFFSSKLGKQLLAAPSCHREFSFSFLLPWEDDPLEKTLIQGTIDCWFESDDGEITVLDFKTNRDPDPDIYSEQITSYALALETMLKRPVSRRFLYFFSGGRVFEQQIDEDGGRTWQLASEL